MGATSSKPLSVTSRNSPPSDCPSIAPSSMLSPTSQPRLSPIRSIPCRQSRSVLLSHEKLITRVTEFGGVPHTVRLLVCLRTLTELEPFGRVERLQEAHAFT